ncbi:hypothetical protein P3T76_009787 [Phytophthora citrophthora]|uniref:HAT C-terminal dimerisation domain-containing protein n=1 Tax=Phytophthora citrophthora TaxID=4793 RepID=A0AAD9GEK8_9STRA|nr:hypothetical protein P3T76_009787 [Phytophthora citrophthora]
MDFFGKEIRQCTVLVGDNCSVNKRLANLMGVPLVGCASHKLNLAVKTILAPYEAELEAVQALMKHLRIINAAAKLRFATPLRPVLRQETRWGSTYAMLKRFFWAARVHFTRRRRPRWNNAVSRCPTKVKGTFRRARRLQSVAMALQSGDLDLIGARDLLNGLIEQKPSVKSVIGPSANIVRSPIFEAGCCKVLADSANILSRDERLALRPMECRVSAPPSEDSVVGSSFAERILKKRKKTTPAVTYPLVRAIPPTSNKVDRLFSTARAMLGHERQALTPFAIEMLLFLKTNTLYWDVQVVDRCV